MRRVVLLESSHRSWEPLLDPSSGLRPGPAIWSHSALEDHLDRIRPGMKRQAVSPFGNLTLERWHYLYLSWDDTVPLNLTTAR